MGTVTAVSELTDLLQKTTGQTPVGLGQSAVCSDKLFHIMESCIVVSQRGFTVRHYLVRVLIIKCFISGLYICIFDLI